MFKEQRIKLFIIISGLFNYSLTNNEVQMVSNPIEIQKKTTPIKEFVSINKEFFIKDYFLKQMNIANVIYSLIIIVSLLGIFTNNKTLKDYRWIISIIIGCCLWSFKGYKIYTFKKEFNVILWKYFTANILLAVATIIISGVLFYKNVGDLEELDKFTFYYFVTNMIYLSLDFLINTISSFINFHYNFSKEDLQLLKNNKPIETNIDNKDIKIDENSTIKEDADKNKK